MHVSREEIDFWIISVAGAGAFPGVERGIIEDAFNATYPIFVH